MRCGKRIIAVALVFLLAGIHPVYAVEAVYKLHIPATKASDALDKLAQETGYSLFYPTDVLTSVTANALNGTYTLPEALDLLLKETPLNAVVTEKGVIVVSMAPNALTESGEEKRVMKTKKGLLATVIGFLVGSGTAQNTVAQENAHNDTYQGKTVLDEIMVTATKKSRAESLQDVPVAITALNETQLEEIHFESIADIGHMFPNATLDEAPFVSGQASFFIRGLGVNHTQQTADPSVGVVINGMALGQNAGMTTDNFDLASLEVLRGPQGTLFGRNVTGGVVVMRTKRPTGDFGFEVRGTLGSYERRDLAFAIEDALIEDKVAGRLAVMYKEHDGYFKNALGGDRIGESRSKIIRPTFLFTPTDDLTINLFAEYGDIDSGMSSLRQIFDPDTIFSTFYVPPNNDLQTLEQDFSGPNSTEWWHTIGEVTWDVGPGQFTSITAYRESEIVVSIDVDGTGLHAIHFLPSKGSQHQFSQELRYALDVSDRFNLTTGLYYFDQSYRSGLGLDIFGGLDIRDGFTDHTSYALFVQGDIALTEDWVLTLGGRYGKETKDGRYATPDGGGCAVPPSNDPTRRTGCNYNFVGSASWENFSPKVALKWVISDKAQVYASWTKGFKSGGFNNEASAANLVGPYDEETVKAYEIGLKTDLLENRMRLNLAAFLNDYSGMQRTVGFYDTTTDSFVTRILNAGSAEVMGLEAELNYLVTERLSLTASLGLMRNDIKEYNGLDVDGDNIPDPEEAEKLDLARVPDLTYGLGVSYEIPFSFGDVTIRGNYSYTGERVANDENLAMLGAYRALNLSTIFRPVGEYNIYVSVFGKNVLDNDEPLYEAKDSFLHTAHIPAPATWGIEAVYKF